MSVVSLNPRITQAGLALFPSAALPGFQVTLTHVALGTGRFIPTGGESALQAEVARFAITSGTNPSPRTVQVGLTITDTDLTGRSANGKGIGEVGFYSGNTLFAIWSQDAEPLFYKSAAFDIPMAYTLDVSLLPASSVTVSVDPSSAGLSALILAHEAKTDPHSQYLTRTDATASYTPIAHVGAADPHAQYLTAARGNAAYAPLAHVTAPDPHAQYLTQGRSDALYTPLAHASAADPHTQYMTYARGDARYTPLAHATAANPHGQYVLRTDSDQLYAPMSHINAADPHTQYLTAARGNAAYAPLGHVSAANPHSQYVLRTDADALYTPTGHQSAPNPHPQYMQRSDTDAAYTPVAHQWAADPHSQYLTAGEGNAAYTPIGHQWEANPHAQYMQRSDVNAGFVKQGGGAGQGTNAIYMGWSGSGVLVTVDSTNFGPIAFQSYVNDRIAALVNGAPGTLDQINELAAAIGSDPNFAVTMANQLAGKERKFDAGVRLACASATAPVGWFTVNDDSTNNRMLRTVPDGQGGGLGGIHNPTVNNVVSAHTHGFTTGTVSSDHVHGVNDPSHVHGGGNMVGDKIYSGGGSNYIEEGQGAPDYVRTNMTAAYTGISLYGISANHTHSGGTDNGSSQTDWQPRYLNIIIIQKQ